MELAGHLEKGWLETELTSRRPVLREGPFSSTLREQLWEGFLTRICHYTSHPQLDYGLFSVFAYSCD